MKIGGFLKQSLIDFPGKIASVVFTAGCNFRCFYCHNPELVLPELIRDNSLFDTQEILNYIRKNSTLLDAIVITGGEPCLQTDLVDFIEEIKTFGLQIKLDTNGTNPKLLNEIIDKQLVDYIAMDVKHNLVLDDYVSVVGETINKQMLNQVKQSVETIKSSEIDFEFRITAVKPIHSIESINETLKQLTGKCFIQAYNPLKTLNGKETFSSFNKEELDKVIIPDNIDLRFR